MRLICLFLCGFVCVNAAFAEDALQQTHPFSIDDMLAMDRISDAQISPRINKGDK